MSIRTLSAYTIAKNCSDKSDCQAGINEINTYLLKMEKQGKKPANSVYIRFYKLHEKMKKLKK